MLKPINPIANRVAEGRKFASRSIVITSLSSIECHVYRRQVIPAEVGKEREETIWEGGMRLSDQEEHATEYKPIGYAMMLFDKFSGGSIHSNGDDINSEEAIFYVQIEPFYIDNYHSKNEMLRNIPDWQPKKGDIFALIIEDDLIKWVECVGSTGQSLHSHHGDRYIMNLRDSLMHLDPFKQHEELLKPVSNIFPIALADLNYQEAPIYDIKLNDPATLADDEIRVKVFKLVNILDPDLAAYPAVIAIKHLAKKTNSPYIFTPEDMQKITVNIGDGEQFILNSDTQVNAVEAGAAYISNMLMMVDHVSIVKKIETELLNDRGVSVKSGDKTVFEIMPFHYDEVRKAYHFVIVINVGQTNDFVLSFVDGTAYPFTIDASALQVVP